MSKFVEDFKVNDIIWTINKIQKPELVPLIITKINKKTILWSEYYHITVKMSNGKNKYISILNTGPDRDFDKPILIDLLPTLKYDYDEEIINDIISTVVCFDKDVLRKYYIEILEDNIKDTEDQINKSKQKLQEFIDQLKYFRNQYDYLENREHI